MKAPDEYVAEATTAWTEEGSARLAQAPPQMRGVAMAAIQRFAVAEGYTMITSSVVDRALEQILPAQARVAMGITRPAARPAIEEDERLALSYLCPSCRYVHAKRRPEQCPVCGARGSRFKLVPGKEDAGGEAARRMETFDGIFLDWTSEALRQLEAIPDYFLRKRARHKIEKSARSQKRQLISGTFAAAALGTEGNAEAPRAAEPSIAADLDSAPAEATGPASSTEQGGGGAAETGAPGGWSDEGWARLLRAPEGFMRDRARETITAYAAEAGAGLITLEVAQEGMARAWEAMIAKADSQ